jgi:hypothetical protein
MIYPFRIAAGNTHPKPKLDGMVNVAPSPKAMAGLKKSVRIPHFICP